MARVAELLLRHGADPLLRDSEGRFPLHLAAARGHAKICELLLLMPGVPNVVDGFCDAGQTPLHLAAACGAEGACDALVRGGADVALRTRLDGKTALHLAALSGRAAAVSYLAAKSPLEVLLAPDASGRSALQLAEKQGHHDAADALRGPEEEHRQLVDKWSGMLREARSEAQLPSGAFQDSVGVDLSPPVLRRVRKDRLELTSCVQDLEYRVMEYVVEVRECSGGPQSAAPARVYYARLGEQRKIDQVAFDVPRARSTGCELWGLGRWYQFRLVGRCTRCPWQPLVPWQVNSEWSEPVLLTLPRTSRRRSGSEACLAQCRTRQL